MEGRRKTTRESIAELQQEITKWQRRLEQVHHRIESRSRQLTRAQKKLATAPPGSEAAGQALRDIERAESSSRSAQNSKALYERYIHKKNMELFQLQAKLASEQDRKQKDLLAQLRTTSAKREREALDAIRSQKLGTRSERMDAFISYASEDKDDVARPLAEQLRYLGINVWYDDYQLEVGDSLRRKIDDGLVRSKYGIVVLSLQFFAKNWPQYELDGLVQKEVQSGQKIILPLWHKISKDEVLSYSPTLADKMALSTSRFTITELAYELGKVMLLAQ